MFPSKRILNNPLCELEKGEDEDTFVIDSMPHTDLQILACKTCKIL